MRGAVRHIVPLVIALFALPFALYAVQFAQMGFGGAVTRFVSAESPMAGPSLHLHALTGGLITALAMAQLLPAVRRRLTGLHKAIGALVAGLALVTAFSGLTYIALRGTIGGAEMSAGFALYGVLMASCAILTLYHAQRGDIRTHGIWARRLVILVLASWLYRVHYGIWYAVTDGLYSNPAFTGAFDRVQNWAFYLPYLIVFEAARRRRAG
jgi:hypothetical protein